MPPVDESERMRRANCHQAKTIDAECRHGQQGEEQAKMRIETPEIEIDPDMTVTYDRVSGGEHWEVKNRIQALRRGVANGLRELGMVHGVQVNLQQSQMQFQLMALIKFVCDDEESRWQFEECYQSAVLDAVDQIQAEAGRAKLLQPPDGATAQVLRGRG